MYSKSLQLKIKGSSENASVVTPDQLIQQVMQAKQLEQNKFPATKNLYFEGESSLLALEKAFQAQNNLGKIKKKDKKKEDNSCLIM